MNMQRLGTLAALVLAALLSISPLFAQSQPPMPVYRPLLSGAPPVPNQANPPATAATRTPTAVAPTKTAPVRTTPTKSGKTFTPAPPPPASPRDHSTPDGADRDGDGWAASEGDCDDMNSARYPGAAEVVNDRDEDCNPDTIGVLDADYDGYTDWRISNFATYGVNHSNSGLDCDDSQAGIRPDAQELPNGIDDNCDGAVDNLLGTWWTPGSR